MRGARLVFALVGVAAAWSSAAPASPARAAVADYDVDANAWNGVGYLLETAAEAKVDVSVAETLDLADLRGDEVLLWLYPVEPLPVEELLAFVRDGGSLIVADDLGAAVPLLAAAGIRRDARGPTSHGRWFEGSDGLPIVTRAGDDFLFFNVDEVVANYPAVLRGEGRPLLSFDAPGEHLAIERRIGDGVLLALGDPSMFLNQMLRRFYGNKQLAANVLRMYCAHEPCQVRLLLPHSVARGSYAGQGGLGPVARTFRRAAARVNAALGALSRALSAPPWSWLVAVGLALGLLAAGAVALAVWRRPLRGPALDAGVPGLSPAVAEAIGLSTVRVDADFYSLARVLAEHASHLADAARLDEIAEGRRPPPPGEGEDAVRALRRALLRLRDDADSLRAPHAPVISAEQFARIHGDVQTVTRFAR